MKKLQVIKNKKIIGAALSIALVVTAAIGVTAAYYQAEPDEVVNQFTVGNVTTELVEEFEQNTDTEFTKTPRVTNTGADNCLVRIRMNVTPDSLLDQKVLDADGKETATNYLVISGWSDKWTQKADGFYYYSDVVEPGETTEPLFTTVTVNYDDYNEWEDFDIIIYQEAVQAEVNANGVTITDPDKIWAAYAD